MDQISSIKFKRSDRTMHIAEYFYTVFLTEPLLPFLSRTSITPNMITIFNVFFSIVLYYLAYMNQFLLLAIGVHLYLFFDVLDGNLARYKNMQSEFGAKLDNLSDRFFYTLIFVFIGIEQVHFLWILIVIILINLYGIIATYYIVPRLRKLKEIKRYKVKAFFMERGLIIGMDLGTVVIIMSVCLLFKQIQWLFIILTVGYVLDILLRLTELWRSERARLVAK